MKQLMRDEVGRVFQQEFERTHELFYDTASACVRNLKGQIVVKR